MTSLHTKLKELRELRERATPAGFPWKVYTDKGVQIFSDGYLLSNVYTVGNVPEHNYRAKRNAEFIAQAANNWLTIIEALEKAVEGLEDIGTTKIAFGPERVSSCSADEAKEALAEIAEMLVGK